jgi:hypothetical protein
MSAKLVRRRRPHRDQLVERIERKLTIDAPWLTAVDKPAVQTGKQFVLYNEQKQFLREPLRLRHYSSALFVHQNFDFSRC